MFYLCFYPAFDKMVKKLLHLKTLQSIPPSFSPFFRGNPCNMYVCLPDVLLFCCFGYVQLQSEKFHRTAGMDYKALEWARALKVHVSGNSPCLLFDDIRPSVQQRVREESLFFSRLLFVHTGWVLRLAGQVGSGRMRVRVRVRVTRPDPARLNPNRESMETF